QGDARRAPAGRSARASGCAVGCVLPRYACHADVVGRDSGEGDAGADRGEAARRAWRLDRYRRGGRIATAATPPATAASPTTAARGRTGGDAAAAARNERQRKRRYDHATRDSYDAHWILLELSGPPVPDAVLGTA